MYCIFSQQLENFDIEDYVLKRRRKSDLILGTGKLIFIGGVCIGDRAGEEKK